MCFVLLSKAFDAWLLSLSQAGLSTGSIRRYRASMREFFNWLKREHFVAENPVADSTVPKVAAAPEQMRPFSEGELTNLLAKLNRIDPFYSDVVCVFALAGLRWGEARALRVGDIVEVPLAGIRVERSQSEGYSEKAPKSGKARFVPIIDQARPALARLIGGKKPADYVFSRDGSAQLWAGRFRQDTNWAQLTGGRRLHDLRHTAACLWLSWGADLATVSGWLGHSSISITDKYVHYLGSLADRSTVAKLSAHGALGNDGGAHGAHVPTPAQQVSVEPPERIELSTYSLRVNRSAD